MKKKCKPRGSLGERVLCLGPSIVIYTIFFIVPLIMGVYYSTTNWDAIGLFSNIGISNYARLLLDSQFMDSIVKTFFFSIFSVLITTICSMVCALALTNRFKGNSLMRTALFLPNLISMVITGFIWSFLFTRVSASLFELTGNGLFNISWIGDQKYVMWALIIVSVWQGLGYYMTIYIAGLISLDESYLEAARIDGASERHVFWRIKLPLMLPTISIGAFMNLACCMKGFDIVFSLTKGGPGNSSELAALNIYNEAFKYNNFGYGCAKAIFFAAIVILFSLVQQQLSNREVV